MLRYFRSGFKLLNALSHRNKQKQKGFDDRVTSFADYLYDGKSETESEGEEEISKKSTEKQPTSEEVQKPTEAKPKEETPKVNAETQQSTENTSGSVAFMVIYYIIRFT